MCGIVGYVGGYDCKDVLMEGLSKLEYRGYDSAGLAVRNGEELAEVVKAKGQSVQQHGRCLTVTGKSNDSTHKVLSS